MEAQIGKPDRWNQFSVTERRAWQLEEQRLQQAADSKAALAKLPPRPANWGAYSAVEKRSWMLQAQAGAR
jgi:hypothetical protein